MLARAHEVKRAGACLSSAAMRELNAVRLFCAPIRHVTGPVAPRPGAGPQMEADDIWKPGTLDPPEKLTTPLPLLPPGYITPRIIPCLAGQP